MVKLAKIPLQNRLRALAITATLAMGCYLLVIFIGDAQKIVQALAGIMGPPLLGILGLSLLNYGLRFLRWQYYVAALNYLIPWRRHLAYYLAGFAFTVTPGKAGEAVRSLYLKAHGMHYADSLATFFVERLLDVLAIAILAIGGAWLFPGYRGFVLFSCLGIGVFGWFIVRPELPGLLQQWAGRMKTSSMLARILRQLAKLLQTSVHLLAVKRVGMGLAVGLLAWAAEGLALYFILQAMQHPLPMSIALSIYAISVLAGAVSFLPGGLGGTEAVMGLLLTMAGIDPDTAIATTLLCRLTTLWFAVLIGLLATVVLEMKKISIRPETL